MQFSNEIESMIASIIANGGMTPETRSALARQALLEGYDPEVVNKEAIARLGAKATQLSHAPSSPRTSNPKYGEVRKCPSCGSMVASNAVACSECGYEFRGIQAVSSVKQLAQTLISLDSVEARHNAITVFPVPNAKEDIIEFLALAAPNTKKKGGIMGTMNGRLLVLFGIVFIIYLLYFIFVAPDFSEYVSKTNRRFFYMASFVILGGGGYGAFRIARTMDPKVLENNQTADVWRAKFDQVMMKARSMQGDAEFSKLLDYYQSQVK